MNEPVGSDTVDDNAEVQAQRKGDAEEDQGAKKVYGDYEVIRPIGKGKFAVVYRAQRISDGLVVALKRISVDQIDQKARDKCLKEVRLLQSLDHPNIIRYLDSFISDDDLVIVVEWAAAGDLKRQLRKAQEKGTPFEERIIWKYFSQIADAIKHMHDRRVMHRDLKPANIFLTLDGTIKVGDLGLSRELSEDTFQAQSKVGTPLYMSPEVLRGDKYDFKTDVWSLGCLLYELAVLKSPFKAEGLNIYSLFQKISEGQYQPIPSEFSEDLRNLAYAMLSTKPEDRPELSYVCDVARRLRVQYQEKHAQNRKLSSSSSKSKLQSPPSNISQADNATTDSPNEPSDPDSKQQQNDNGSEYKFESRIKNPDAPESKSKVSSKAPHVDGMPVMSLNSQWDAEDLNMKDVTTATRDKSTKVQKQSDVTAYDGWGFDDPSPDIKMPTSSRGDALASSQTSGNEVYKRPKSTQSNRALAAGSGGAKNAATKASTVSSGKPPLPSSSGKDASSRISDGGDIGDDNTPQSVGLFRPASQGQLVLDANLSDSGQAFASMSLLHDKLLVLGYQFGVDSASSDKVSNKAKSKRASVPILPCQFAVDVAKIGAGGRSDRHIYLSSTAFTTFVAVASWLLGRIEESMGVPGYKAPELDLDDAPHLLAKRLLLETQAIGIASAEISDINATSLLPGYGLRVCQLLNIVADKALVACKHSWKPFKYESLESPDANDAKDDGGIEVDDEVDDEIEARGEGSRDAREDSVEFGKSHGDGLHRSMILPSPEVSPEEWGMETERVATKLSSKMTSTRASQGGYMTNMTNIERHSRSLRNGGGTDADFSADALQSSLALLGSGASDSVASIRRVESMLNGRWASLQVEMQSLLKSKDDCNSSVKVAGERIEALSAQLAELSDKADEANEALESRSGGGPANEEGGNAPVIALKQAIRALRDEVTAMTLSIGLVSAQLLDEQRRTVQTRQRRINNKQRPTKGEMEEDDEL